MWYVTGKLKYIPSPRIMYTLKSSYGVIDLVLVSNLVHNTSLQAMVTNPVSLFLLFETVLISQESCYRLPVILTLQAIFGVEI